jgi:predicted NACHT family NTPase
MLKSEIRNSDNHGLRELISNSFLLSAICSMSFRAHREGITTVTLPNHRVHLYEDAVEWMLNAWQIKDPKMNMIDVKRTLCQLATYIHENSASGLIDHSTLIELCRSNETSDERAIHFTRIIRDEVGVLTARGEFAYGFLHLTFQEYLTGLAIIYDNHSIEKIVHKFIEKISNPRYREPLLLALGLISWKWSQEEYDLFCGKLLEEQQHQNENFTSLVPLGALLLVSSLNDLVKLPSDTLIFDAFDQLLIASGKHQWFIDHPNLSKIIIQGLQKLTAIKVNK